MERWNLRRFYLDRRHSWKFGIADERSRKLRRRLAVERERRYREGTAVRKDRQNPPFDEELLLDIGALGKPKDPFTVHLEH
jgi:hypothetical protein